MNLRAVAKPLRRTAGVPAGLRRPCLQIKSPIIAGRKSPVRSSVFSEAVSRRGAACCARRGNAIRESRHDLRENLSLSLPGTP